MFSRTSFLVLAAVTGLLGLCFGAQAVPVLDQSNTADPLTYNGLVTDTIFRWQQQVTAGAGGILAGIELFTQPSCNTGFPCPDPVTISIGLGSGFFTGALAFTTAATITQNGTFIDTSSANITLTPGEKFVIDISGGSTSSSPYIAATTTIYAGGDLFLDLAGTIYDETTLQNLSGGQNLLGTPGQTMAFETFLASDPSRSLNPVRSQC